IRPYHGLLILLLFASLGASQQTTPTNPSQAPTFPPMPKPDPGNHLPVGQTLVYGAEWRFFNAGTATLRLEQTAQTPQTAQTALQGDAPESHVLGTADAAGAVALLYHVRDRYESFFSSSNFCSRMISKKMEEGLRRVNADIKFDYARGKAVLDQKNL